MLVTCSLAHFYKKRELALGGAVIQNVLLVLDSRKPSHVMSQAMPNFRIFLFAFAMILTLSCKSKPHVKAPTQSREILSQLNDAKSAEEERAIFEKWIELHPAKRSISLSQSDLKTATPVIIKFSNGDPEVRWSPIDRDNIKYLYSE